MNIFFTTQHNVNQRCEFAYLACCCIFHSGILLIYITGKLCTKRCTEHTKSMQYIFILTCSFYNHVQIDLHKTSSPSSESAQPHLTVMILPLLIFCSRIDLTFPRSRAVLNFQRRVRERLLLHCRPRVATSLKLFEMFIPFLHSNGRANVPIGQKQEGNLEKKIEEEERSKSNQ